MAVITILEAILIVLLAALTQGLTGFGYSLISVPFLVLLFSPKFVVPVIILHSTLLNAIILRDCREHADLKRIWPLILFGCAGMPFGVHLLTIIEQHALKVIIGILIIVFGSFLLLGIRKTVKNEKLAFVPVGLLSGLMNGSISFSGPPVIIFLANQNTKKQKFRASLVAYFLCLNIATLPVFFARGLVSAEVAYIALLTFPGMIAGAILGSNLSHRVSEGSFKKIMLAIVLASGALSILSGFSII